VLGSIKNDETRYLWVDDIYNICLYVMKNDGTCWVVLRYYEKFGIMNLVGDIRNKRSVGKY